MKKLFSIALFALVLGFVSSVSAADIFLKLDGIKGATLYRCENGSVVEDSVDCGGQVSMAQYRKIDGIEGECNIDMKIDGVEGECKDRSSMSASGGGGKVDIKDINIIKYADNPDCSDCGDEVEVETAGGPLALGLGAIIAIGADCPRCLFEEEEIDVEDETAAGPLALGLGAIIAIGATNLETDEDALVDCKVTKVGESNIECEVVAIHEIKGESKDKISGSGCTGPEDTSPGCDGISDEASVKRSGGEDRLTENVSLNVKVKGSGGEDRLTENISLRAQIKENRKEYISTYKGAFVKKIGNRLDNIPAKNLEVALEKINAKMDETEENEKMSDAKKESYMDALYALLEIVEDKIGDIKGE